MVSSIDSLFEFIVVWPAGQPPSDCCPLTAGCSGRWWLQPLLATAVFAAHWSRAFNPWLLIGWELNTTMSQGSLMIIVIKVSMRLCDTQQSTMFFTWRSIPISLLCKISFDEYLCSPPSLAYLLLCFFLFEITQILLEVATKRRELGPNYFLDHGGCQKRTSQLKKGGWGLAGAFYES